MIEKDYFAKGWDVIQDTYFTILAGYRILIFTRDLQDTGYLYSPYFQDTEYLYSPGTCRDDKKKVKKIYVFFGLSILHA